MFLMLILATFLSSLLVCAVTIALFWRPVAGVLTSRLAAESALLWTRILLLATCVIGISVGSRLWDLEGYMHPSQDISSSIIWFEAYKSAVLTAQACFSVVVVMGVGIAIFALMKKSTGE